MKAPAIMILTMFRMSLLSEVGTPSKDELVGREIWLKDEIWPKKKRKKQNRPEEPLLDLDDPSLLDLGDLEIDASDDADEEDQAKKRRRRSGSDE